MAAVGTVAEIREATRYADGRYDLVTLGTQRFRLEGVDPEAEPYLVGQVTPLGEVLGEAGRARALGDRVMQLFIQYLEMLQVDEQLRQRRGPPAGAEPGAPVDAGTPVARIAGRAVGAGRGRPRRGARCRARRRGGPAGRTSAATPAEPDEAVANSTRRRSTAEDRARAEFLTEAARQLTIPDDPTVLSYLLSGIVQIESIRRQGLLEMPTTESRLEELAHLLEREIALLQRGLGSYVPDPRLTMLRRN